VTHLQPEDVHEGSPPTAHIVQCLAPGGLEVLALELARHLPGRHLLISLEGTVATLKANWPRIGEVALVGCEKSGGLEPGLVLRLARILRRAKVNCVMTHHIGPLIYGGLAARLAGVGKVIHVEHDIWHYETARRRQVAGLAMRLVRPQLVAISPQLVARLKLLFPARPVRLIENGVDLQRFSPMSRQIARENLGLSGKIIGSAGRLELVKGHDVLLRAFARMASVANLVIAGNGSQRGALEALARELGIADRVRFLGHTDSLAEIYPGFDVFCLSSRHEGLPLAVLEAQACGVPVVASAVGGVAAALSPQCSKTVPPEDPLALARALDQVLQNADPVDPRAFVAAHFDWAKCLSLYSQMIGA